MPMEATTSQPGSDSTLKKCMHLLIVDDDDAILDSLSLFLSLEGHEVSAAKSGAEAADRVTLKKPDALITDFRLAHETGFDVIRAIRKSANATIPAIVMTGDTRSAIDDSAKFLKCQIIRKPFKPDVLMRAVHALVSVSPRRTWNAPALRDPR